MLWYYSDCIFVSKVSTVPPKPEVRISDRNIHCWCLVTTETSYLYNIIIYHRKLYYDCVCIIILKNVFYQPLSDNSWDVTESTESPPISKRSAAVIIIIIVYCELLSQHTQREWG